MPFLYHRDVILVIIVRNIFSLLATSFFLNIGRECERREEWGEGVERRGESVRAREKWGGETETEKERGGDR